MVKIRKPSIAPEVPDNAGHCKLIQETAKNIAEYDTNQTDYDNGQKKFKFDNNLYGHDIIKSKLRNLQNGKCAFCEQNVSSVSHGDIEHFRPKAGYKQNIKSKLSIIGYYWLAYNWGNLIFSCQICNQRYKGNLFPLLDPNMRAKNHHFNLKFEKPYFINPALENPVFFIKFKKEIAIGIDKRNRGSKTIEAIGLNRSGNGYSDLLELRRDYLELIDNTFKLANMNPNPDISQAEIDKAKDLMKKFKNRRNKFSAMIRDNF